VTIDHYAVRLRLRESRYGQRRIREALQLLETGAYEWNKGATSRGHSDNYILTEGYSWAYSEEVL